MTHKRRTPLVGRMSRGHAGQAQAQHSEGVEKVVVLPISTPAELYTCSAHHASLPPRTMSCPHALATTALHGCGCKCALRGGSSSTPSTPSTQQLSSASS